MNYLARLALIDPNEATRGDLKKALSGMDIVWLEAEAVAYHSAPLLLEETHPDIAVVCLDADQDQAIDVIAQIHSELPDCSVCAASASSDGRMILRAMRAGAKEFLTLPVNPEELAGVVRSMAGGGEGEGGPLRGSTTIAVAGATGGVGSTSIAVNLASNLALDSAKSVVFVDLDLALGDADVFLDAVHDYTLSDVVQNVSRLDFDLLRRSLAKLKSGLFLLPRPVELEEALAIQEESLRRVLGLLKASFSHVVLDVSKAYNALDLAALECADVVLLVTQLDLPNLRNVVRLLKSFEAFGGMREKIKVIVNRVGQGNEPIRMKKAQETIGQKVFWQVPNDYRLMVEMRNNGVPLIEQAPRSDLTRCLVELAQTIGGGGPAGQDKSPSAAAAAPSLGKWFSFWSSASAK